MAIDYNNPASFDNSPAMQQEFFDFHKIEESDYVKMRDWFRGPNPIQLPLVHSKAEIDNIISGADPKSVFFAIGGDSAHLGYDDLSIELVDVNNPVMSNGSKVICVFGTPLFAGLISNTVTFKFVKVTYLSGATIVDSIAFEAIGANNKVLYFDKGINPTQFLENLS